MVVVYVMVAVLGLLIGSFLNVCIYRIPRGESVAYPPSHCTSCGKRLGALELIPVFSYLFLGGKCRGCRTGISPRYTLVELLTAVVYLALYVRYGLSVEFLAAAFLLSVLIPVFFIDLAEKIIPDGLVLAAVIGGAVLYGYSFTAPVEFYGDRNWWNPLVGMLCGSGFLLLVALVGMAVYKSEDVMGMGDVKLFIPIGLILGWKLCLLTLLLSVVLSGITSLLLMATGIKKRSDTIPLGPFIAVAVFVVMLWGWDLIHWYFSML